MEEIQKKNGNLKEENRLPKNTSCNDGRQVRKKGRRKRQNLEEK